MSTAPVNPASVSSSTSASDAETLRRGRILSSKLYFDVPLTKVPIIYSSSYDIAFLGMEKLHPFDSSKWGRICRFLILDGALEKNHIVEPLEASKDDLLVVHSESYLNSLKTSLNVAVIIEVPPVALLPNCLVQQKVLYPFRKQVGGTILAAKLAKERGWAINVGGGFHHCSAGKGGGFCAYADISLCIHYAFIRLNISRVMIIDLDAHQGNGHEMDFSNDRRVYILDMYNPGIYPSDFEARRYIDQKVEVVSGTTTNEYLTKLDEALKIAMHIMPGWNTFYLYSWNTLGHCFSFYLRVGWTIVAGLVYIRQSSSSSSCSKVHKTRDSLVMEHQNSHNHNYLCQPILMRLKMSHEVAGRMFDPELVVYNAGTDILDGDPLGRLKISPEGVTSRDEKVFRFAREKKIPLIMLTSGLILQWRNLYVPCAAGRGALYCYVLFVKQLSNTSMGIESFSGGYMKSSAKVIADSIVNLSRKCLIDTGSSHSRG
ncbi:Histone deacetylase 2 [Vitis vinifera]|uniref:Histone deacetylase 2 n=1 Tax=Vitis vinifera TaxID=29760 RepID=A0A438K8U1_VITVI|nr:Histone deacetylase 2 [Vitis vinifera]